MSNETLLSIVDGPSWSDVKDYALRILAEQKSAGTVAGRHLFHTSRAHEAATAGVEGAPEYHHVHAALTKAAGRFLRDAPNGEVRLAANAPKDVREAWGILQSGDHGVHIGEVGRLGDTHIAEQVGAGEHVHNGALWQGVNGG